MNPHTSIIYVRRNHYGDIKVFPAIHSTEILSRNYEDMMAGSSPRYKILPFEFSHLPWNNNPPNFDPYAKQQITL